MARKLLLTSSGVTEDIRKDFLSILPKPPREIKVEHITTAAYGEAENPWWLEGTKNQLKDCGIQDVEDIDIKGKNEGELENILSYKDMILVNGGNTFYLSDCSKKSGFDKVPKLLDEGKVYVGVSAGSYLTCPTIEAAGWKHADRNIVGIKDLTALGLVDFLITAHFAENYRQVIENAAKNTNYPIVALYDGQAVLVDGSSYRIVGKGKREFFNGFKEKI